MNISLKKRQVTKGIIEINLPASKSISNRLLMIQKQCASSFKIQNLSEAGDTQILQNTLNSNSKEWDLYDAGTPLRFLTVYAAATGFAGIITGNDSLRRRPIMPLIEALGIENSIEWLGVKGFVPFRLITRTDKTSFKLNADKSSQYISALLLCTPLLGGSIRIELTNKSIPSKPYLDMTIALMQEFGAEITFKDNIIKAKVDSYKNINLKYKCESDWTAASYFFTMCAASGQSYLLKGLQKTSLQGDKILIEWFNQLGLISKFTETGLIIKKDNQYDPKNIIFNFINNPDLAPAVIVCCALINKKATFTGTKTLKYKESDRMSALKNELMKCGIGLISKNNIFILTGKTQRPNRSIATYNDHRLAMAMACISSIYPLLIEDNMVVKKSFPNFWREITKLYD